MRVDPGGGFARGRSSRRSRGVVPPGGDSRGRVRRGAGGVHRAGRRRLGPGRRGRRHRPVPADLDERCARRFSGAAGAGQAQRDRPLGLPTSFSSAVRAMRIRRCGVLALLVACGHGGRDSGLAPEALLDRARTQFRHGEFSQAQQSYQRLLFELPPNDPTLPEVHYYFAESQFQAGQLLEAAQQFRQTADQYAGSAYAPLALLRAGDANLRLWRKPELDPSYGQSALAIYQDLAGRYPDSDAAARAQLHVRRLREWFADKDYKNGLFYFK